MGTIFLRTNDFIASLGVGTHIPYTDGGYANIANVEADLQYLGISSVRDGITNGQFGSAPLSSYVAVARQGIKFTICIAGGGANTTASVDATLALIVQLNTAVPGSVVAVEGLNEINNSNPTYNGVGGLAGAISLQKDLYAAVHGNPALKGVAVDYFTGYDAGSVATGPNPATTPGLADFDTQHPYPGGGEAPAAWVAPARTLVNETAPFGPAVYTETGYSTDGGTSGGVNADVQANYTLDLLMDDAKNGIARTYLYQLLDDYAPGSRQGDDGFGLFDPANAPKEAATGIHNLIAILDDTGAAAATFTATSLAYSVAGLPSTGNSLVLEKSNGDHEIVLWNEPKIWDEASGAEIAAAPVNVTVQLDAAYQTLSVFDPLVSASPIKTLTDASQVALTLTDHPVILQVGPALAASAPVTVGSGPDSIVLEVSEDAYLGNAQFTVSVDGVLVGGTQTATALHAAGADQAFTVKGSFGAGQHTVVVDFLNDLYGGSPSADRNLYVDSIVANGITTKTSAALMSAGPVSFTVPAASDPTPAAPPSTVTLGSGPDTLALAIAEEAYNGNAQFTIAVNGTQIGGAQTATALEAAGASQTYDVLGSFPSQDTATLTFLNDAYGGSPALDRNLYLIGSSIDGQAIPGGVLTEMSQGPQTFSFQKPDAASQAQTSPVVLNLSEDAYLGDAQFTVSIDGQPASAAQAVTALHDTGASEAFKLAAMTAGIHDVAVSFINDRYGGSPSMDRNLYVNSIDVNGLAAPNTAAVLFSTSTVHFTLSIPA